VTGEGRTAGGAVPEGPVQRRLLQLLGERSPGFEMTTSLATRSTLGPGTIALRPLGDAEDSELDALAAWVGAQPGVEQVARKKSQLHVRLALDVLRVWFCDGWQEELPASPDEPQAVTVAIPEPDSPTSLGAARQASVARSIAALLGERHELEVTASADEHIWVDGGEGSPKPGPQRVDVAEVDLRHDRLRARHGGAVTLEDLLADISDDAIALEGRKRSDDFAEALVSCLMTQVPRKRRLGVDNEAVSQKLSELDEIEAARTLAEEKGEGMSPAILDPSPQAEDRIRTLIRLLEAALSARSAARRQLDPALVNRLLRPLAQAIEAARDDLPDGDPLWPASAEILASALRSVAPAAAQLAPASGGIRT
jgi:hypothetical protein